MLTVKEVAQSLRMHPITVYRLIEKGELKVVRIGKAIRIEEADLRKFIKSRKA